MLVIKAHSVKVSLAPAAIHFPNIQKILHMENWTPAVHSFLLFYIIVAATWLQCDPILLSSGCMATLPSPVSSAGSIVQQLGM